MLRTLVPDVSKRDVYICGPEGFADSLVSAAQRLGVPEERIHREQFAF
jgi:ferredoxin-NADP reductase